MPGVRVWAVAEELVAGVRYGRDNIGVHQEIKGVGGVEVGVVLKEYY